MLLNSSMGNDAMIAAAQAAASLPIPATCGGAGEEAAAVRQA
jgi:hypothetical protein